MGGDVDQRVQVGEARVHAAVGDEADQVHAGRVAHGRHEDGVGGEGAIGDGVFDAREVLAHDGAGAEVEVTDLGVAHLPFGQAHGAAAGGELRVRVGRPELVEDRRVGERDGIAGTGGGA